MLNSDQQKIKICFKLVPVSNLVNLLCISSPLNLVDAIITIPDVPRVGLLTPCFILRGEFLYTMIVLGEGFCSLQVVSRGFVLGGWFWMKLIPALPVNTPPEV